MFAVFFEEIIFLLLSLFFVLFFHNLTINKFTVNKIYKLKKMRTDSFLCFSYPTKL